MSWQALVEVDKSDLIDLGMPLGERKLLLRAIADAAAAAPPPPGSGLPVSNEELAAGADTRRQARGCASDAGSGGSEARERGEVEEGQEGWERGGAAVSGRRGKSKKGKRRGGDVCEAGHHGGGVADADHDGARDGVGEGRGGGAGGADDGWQGRAMREAGEASGSAGLGVEGKGGEPAVDESAQDVEGGGGGEGASGSGAGGQGEGAVAREKPKPGANKLTMKEKREAKLEGKRAKREEKMSQHVEGAAAAAAAAAARDAKGTGGGESGLGSFALQQAGGDMREGGTESLSKDIVVEGFSISVAGKTLFENADLRIAHGFRYGLVGPNGQGKSTLLLHMAHKKLAIPAHIDVVMVEQEVAAGDQTPLDIVLSADVVTNRLEAEKAKLEEAQLEAFDAAAQARLEDIYSELGARDAEAREGSARRILLGLGFPHDWQVTSKQSPHDCNR